jgi:hypothetical protein
MRTMRSGGISCGLKRPGFSGGSLVWIIQPYRGSQGLHGNWLQPLRAGCIRWGQRGGGC